MPDLLPGCQISRTGLCIGVGLLWNDWRASRILSVRRAGNMGTPATIERERERKLENRMIVIHLDRLAC
jgi:hypothetical protein